MNALMKGDFVDAAEPWAIFRAWMAEAEAALIEEEEVEAGEVRCDKGELLAQWRLRQAQCSRDGEPVRRGVEEHEGAVVTSAGEIEAGYQLQIAGRHVTPRSLRSEKDNFAGLRVPRRSYPLVRLRCWPGGSACGAQGLPIFLPPLVTQLRK